MNWLTEELGQEVRWLFEPRYKRQLTNDEVVEIAENLANFVESVLKFKCRQHEEKKAN